MITFKAVYFDGKSSSAHKATVIAGETEIRILDADDSRLQKIFLEDVVISPPLGKTRRSLLLPDGSRCETDDQEAIAALEHRCRGNRGTRLVHFFESSWKAVFCFLIGLVVCVWGFLTYGIPLLAKEAAFAIPPAIMEKIGRETAEVFDARFMRPSKLDNKTTNRLQEVFRSLIAGLDSATDYCLEFRRGGKIGANAFALPSGTILMTDELVNKAENDRELAGILLHEIAHIEQRHGLRTVFQNTGVFLLISVLVGDIASVSSTAATLPTLLAQTGYSRKFEQEADEAAARYLLKNGMSTRDYQAILARISGSIPEFPGSSIFSTHPDTSDRIKHLQEMEDQNDL